MNYIRDASELPTARYWLLPDKPLRCQRVVLEEPEQHVRDFLPTTLTWMYPVTGQVLALPDQLVGLARRGAIDQDLEAGG